MNKKGFTLVELLVVIAIMGILSGIGVAGLRDSVINSRVRDAAISVSAYMERTAQEASRLSSALCVVMTDDNTLKTYKGACPSGEGTSKSYGDLIDHITLESKNTFVSSNVSTGNDCSAILSKDLPASFVPAFGLSAAPSGCVIIRYGSSDKVGLVVKSPAKNKVFYKVSYNLGSSWMEF